MKSYIIDIDGTILDGSSELNNSKQFMQFLQNTGSDFLLATNSIKSHDLQVQRLRAIGITVSTEIIYTPIDSINKYLERNKINNVYVVGNESEISQIHATHSSNMPELIILLDFEKNNFSYNNLQTVIDHIAEGAKIITASRSTYYLKYKKKQIDTGAFVCLIESVTGLSIPVF
ncbi:MAG: hypothetical protein JEZ04_19235 [Spirochaetales bacterium]|nr:hypothetical protein [Spirochaetales bacterium]